MDTGFNDIFGQLGHATTDQTESTSGRTVASSARLREVPDANGHQRGSVGEDRRVPQKLYRDFSNLIAGDAMDEWGFSNRFAIENLLIDQRAKLAPVFFIADVAATPNAEGEPSTSVDSLRLPFESFWICSWKIGGAGIENIFHYFERNRAVLVVRRYLNSGPRDAWAGKVFRFNSNLLSALNDPTFTRALVWEALGLVDLVNSPSDQIDDPPQSVLVRQQLAVGGRDWKQTRFITVRPNRSGRHLNGHNGAPKCPHNRRGHWRHYPSGKAVWIADCAIHGGSQGGRNYVVSN